MKTQGISLGDACCGYVCMGPLGLLCGLCGAGSSETKEDWVCCYCGTRFTTQEAQKSVQKSCGKNKIWQKGNRNERRSWRPGAL